MVEWSLETARQVYGLDKWGSGYVTTNANGHLVVQPCGQSKVSIDLHDLVADIETAGLRFPVLVRFPDILKHRIQSLCNGFKRAAETHGYTGKHTAVYPIKVNQQRCVVEEVLHHGGENVGLEAGSKPELMAVMACSKPGGVIVCNGYKDKEYIRLALIGQKLGHTVYIVVEKPSEIDLILQQAQDLKVEPNIGVRIRLASIGKGKWQNSGGEKAKFGLSASQVLEAVKKLKNSNSLQNLKLLHFHMGSQIANIQDLKNGLQEAVRHYTELCDLGVPLCILDIGGGLAIDYDGTGSRNDCSMNYSIDDYAAHIIQTVKQECDRKGITHPAIITESGRAMTAHHAMLITNVIETESLDAENSEGLEDVGHEKFNDLNKIINNSSSASITEQYHMAQSLYEEAQELYKKGDLSLYQRANIERHYFSACRLLQKKLENHSRNQQSMVDDLNEKLADKYFCNFSIFQSMPDVWGIDQIFPIVPLHRLDEFPSCRGIIHDLTCDSDGHIEFYTDNQGVEKTLPLHPVKKNETYWLGVFLLGAYQEILGDMHNLFGDTDAINVQLNDNGHYDLVGAEYGDSVQELLTYVHFNIADMLQTYQQKITAAVLSGEESAKLLLELEEGIQGYTYFE